MPSAVNQYRPDYGVPPGQILKERLEAHGIPAGELASRCELTQAHLNDIIDGGAPVDQDLALKFERELGLDAEIWLSIEDTYRRFLARDAEGSKPESLVWLNNFPISELVGREEIDEPVSKEDAVVKLLTFFDVSSVIEWNDRYAASSVAYRHSPAFESDEFNLATWLRLGALEAEWQERADFDRSRFADALREIRRLTREPTGTAFERSQGLCNDAGVALVLLKPMPNVALSGAAWWLTPTEPVIQLSGRHKTNDHLWFTLFHEAAHILLHSNDLAETFIDDESGKIAVVDTEADEWAADFLVPREEWDWFVGTGRFSGSDVHEFASQQGVAPAIVVGRLQHEKLIPWSYLNNFKARMTWK